MKVSNDKNIGREALKGFYMFLFSESLRHAQDISDISDRMAEVVVRCNLTVEETEALEKEGLRYVTI
jgi:hypothetical protein